MGDITLSKKYGVNPSICRCGVCGKEIGIALLGASYKVNGKEAKAPMEIAHGLCDDCSGVIKKGGCLFIEVKDNVDKADPNRYKTGRVIGVTKECRERLGAKDDVAFMPESLFSDLFNQYINK